MANTFQLVTTVTFFMFILRLLRELSCFDSSLFIQNGVLTRAATGVGY